MNAAELRSRHCHPTRAGENPLAGAALEALLGALPEWQHDAGSAEIWREYGFKDFYQTIAFVNALAWVANTEDHHPELEVGYKRCKVRYSTHALGGLSENDFICAARIDALLEDKE